ncbi:Helix-turn-helix domain-containing protein [Amycolatopsis marina]|uniref:Helix-turn-helix domain-containing protein n=1 Tax=Amycolatopsis marina TaxID=490629 RepID=A0A1I1ANZ3_9PSEU|nr:helix-turn-helix transcriptional regulator [Amycolatopsis marina]SFB39775.1 Helix-turn-helix domain-containing protein [Amycolatopsis marina]
MNTQGSSVRARELGSELKRWREKSGLTAQRLALSLGWSPSKVCRMEGGSRSSPDIDVAVYLARCDAPRRERDRLLRLARQSDAEYRLQDHGEKLPDELYSLIELETTADVIASYEPLVVPGLLQTEAYVRELLRWGKHPTGDEFEIRVRARLARQRILHRQRPPRLGFFVHECALRSMVGSARLMNEQLLHLALASSWPRCEVRVIESATMPVGVFGGSFRLMRFSEHRPVAYAKTLTASLFLEEAEKIRRYAEVLNELAVHALNGGQSREWLASLASEYDRVETDRDDPAAPFRPGLA